MGANVSVEQFRLILQPVIEDGLWQYVIGFVFELAAELKVILSNEAPVVPLA